MLLTRLLNACHHFPGFVYEGARLCELAKTIEINVRPRQGSKSPILTAGHNYYGRFYPSGLQRIWRNFNVGTGGGQPPPVTRWAFSDEGPYSMIPYYAQTIEHIGEVMGVSKGRVSQIHKQALVALRLLYRRYGELDTMA